MINNVKNFNELIIYSNNLSSFRISEKGIEYFNELTLQNLDPNREIDHVLYLDLNRCGHLCGNFVTKCCICKKSFQECLICKKRK